MHSQTQWHNVLLTDSGFYYNNELDKPLDLLINRLEDMLEKPFANSTVLFIPTASMQDAIKAHDIIYRLKGELLTMGFLESNHGA